MLFFPFSFLNDSLGNGERVVRTLSDKLKKMSYCKRCSERDYLASFVYFIELNYFYVLFAEIDKE